MLLFAISVALSLILVYGKDSTSRPDASLGRLRGALSSFSAKYTSDCGS